MSAWLDGPPTGEAIRHGLEAIYGEATSRPSALEYRQVPRSRSSRQSTDLARSPLWSAESAFDLTRRPSPADIRGAVRRAPPYFLSDNPAVIRVGDASGLAVP